LPRRKSGLAHRRVDKGRPAQDARLIWWILGGVALLVCLAMALLLYRAIFAAAPPAAPGVAERPPIKVDPAAGGRLEPILRLAHDGDRIVLQSDVTAEVDLFVAKKNLTIEAEPGKTITWRCPPRIPRDANKLLLVSAVAGLQLKGITLDGDGRLDNLLVLFGECPGTRLENLILKGYKKHGIQISNCSGSSEQRIVLANLHFFGRPGQTGLFFDVLTGSGVTANRYISVRDCSFHGGSRVRTPNPGFIDRSTVEMPLGVSVEVGS
jgi:hypothetical protein